MTFFQWSRRKALLKDGGEGIFLITLETLCPKQSQTPSAALPPHKTVLQNWDTNRTKDGTFPLRRHPTRHLRPTVFLALSRVLCLRFYEGQYLHKSNQLINPSSVLSPPSKTKQKKTIPILWRETGTKKKVARRDGHLEYRGYCWWPTQHSSSPFVFLSSRTWFFSGIHLSMHSWAP